jgi:hypothetical protein
LITASRKPCEIVAKDASDYYLPSRLATEGTGARDVTLRLVAPRRFVLDARDESGASVMPLAVQIESARWSPTLESTTRGPFELSAPDVPFSISVRAPFHGAVRLGPFDGARVPDVVSVSLPSLPGVTGRVLLGGRPASGASVLLHRVSPRDRGVTLSDFPTDTMPEPVASGACDADGRFRLDLQTDGEFMLRAEAKGAAPSTLGPLALLASSGRVHLELTLSSGGSLTGRVLLPADIRAEKTFVAVSRGDCFPRTTRVAPDGTYRFEHLAPGDWQIEVRDEEISPLPRRWYPESLEAAPPRWRCAIAEGLTTSQDLAVSSLSSCSVAGVLRVDHARPALWSVSLCAPSGGPWHIVDHAIVDPTERFHLRARHGGAHEIVVTGRVGASTVEIRDSVFLARGETSWTCALATTSLTGRVVRGEAGVPVEVLIEYRADDPGDERGGSLVYRARVMTDADGAFAFPVLPAGRGRLEYQGKTRDLLLTAGVSATVELE